MALRPDSSDARVLQPVWVVSPQVLLDQDTERTSASMETPSHGRGVTSTPSPAEAPVVSVNRSSSSSMLLEIRVRTPISPARCTWSVGCAR